MMSQQSKRELSEVLRTRYLKASKVKKQRMLDEFTAVTGYRRKYAIRGEQDLTCLRETIPDPRRCPRMSCD
jgi:hypothetical protein